MFDKILVASYLCQIYLSLNSIVKMYVELCMIIVVIEIEYFLSYEDTIWFLIKFLLCTVYCWFDHVLQKRGVLSSWCIHLRLKLQHIFKVDRWAIQINSGHLILIPLIIVALLFPISNNVFDSLQIAAWCKYCNASRFSSALSEKCWSS